MVRRDGHYILFYSGNWFDGDRYAVAYAHCVTALGPCFEQDRILVSRIDTNRSIHGPGHQALIEHDGKSYIMFHSWYPRPDARPRCRPPSLAELRWDVDTAGLPVPKVISPSPPRTGLVC